jgi:coproporphyrinogen III oxidase
MGVSLVLHPRNPYAPTVHMNVRFFSTTNAAGEPVWWFGGGMDLTPYYGNQDDASTSTRPAATLAPFGADLHALQEVVRRVLLPEAPQEARGVGGIFFDDYNAGGFEQSFAMTQSVGDAFLKAYLPILEAQGHAVRRARTRFPGLPARPLCRIQPGVRPRHAVRPAVGRPHRSDPDVDAADRQMALSLEPEAGSPEAALYTDFLPHRDWLAA